ncbi:MAG: acetyl-CoA carboxylase biotin carboxyl carrier protein subunit [Myxococcota bacterium]
MGTEFELEDETTSVRPTRGLNSAEGPRRFALSIEDRCVEVLLRPSQQECEFLLELDGQQEPVYVATTADGYGDVHFIHFRGRAYRVEAINALVRAQQAAAPSGGDDRLLAPMPGVVVEISTTVGDIVTAGQRLLTIESMKLQTVIVAPHAGRVLEIGLSAGANFEQGAVLIRLEATDEEPGESP